MSSSELLELFKTKADFVIRDPEGNDITEECIVTAMVLANINNEEFRDHVLSYAN